MKRKLLSLVLALALCLGLAVPALADDVPDDSVTLTYEQEVPGGTIIYTTFVRPDKPWSGIWRLSEVSNTATDLTFLEHITYQWNGVDYSGPVEEGNLFFRGCTNLVSVTLPQWCTEVSGFMFEDCTALQRVTIPDSVASIKSYAFKNCSSLTQVNFPAASLVSIEDKAFADCTSLREIVIPGSVTEMSSSISSWGPFTGCSSLTKVTFQEGAASIPDKALFQCASLTDVVIPSTVKEIGENAFAQCKALTHITIPEGVASIGNSAFADCSSLSSVAIPSTVTQIGEKAFSNCKVLDGMVLPAGLTALGSGAFSGCSSLSSLTIPGGVTEVNDVGGGMTRIDFCEGVTKIAGYNDSSTLTAVTIPSTIKELDAFSDCYDLTDIYYTGSEAQWNSIQISSRCRRLNYIAQGAIEGSAIHYNSSPAVLPDIPDAPVSPAPSDSMVNPAGSVSFTDVPNDAYYADAVKWAASKGITNGTGANTFSPEDTCTQVQIITFLWRAAGEPAAAAQSPVSVESYYADAMNWAYEKGMIGADFDPAAPCTRADTVHYLWQAEGSPSGASSGAFSDVPSSASYAQAVAWAVENGITTGDGANTFSPDKTCTRGQIVTFLHRAFA